MAEIELSFQVIEVIWEQLIGSYGVSILAVLLAFSLVHLIGYLGRR
jgi:hypothetical protein